MFTIISWFHLLLPSTFSRPGDSLSIQTRMTHNYSECKNHHSEAPFQLPVVYEDDHFAIVNKPEGIVVFSHKGGDFGRNCVKSCLPWVLTPPKSGVMSVMRRPSPVHRIDRGTSGLLVCAKTKPAMVELSRMFKERKVKKTCEFVNYLVTV
jgi:23S rRNA-/tRNA-specific pseudouridylate synthase